MVRYTFIFICGMILGSMTFGQSARLDSLKLANHNLDVQILDNLKKLQSEKSDFIILRMRDSTNIQNNYCKFLVNKDSCTARFELNIKNDFSVGYVFISDVASAYDPNFCSKDFFEIARDLREIEGLFVERSQPLLDLESSALTFYGKWNEFYFIRYLDSDFIKSFHSGMIYDIICNYFVYNCDR